MRITRLAFFIVLVLGVMATDVFAQGGFDPYRCLCTEPGCPGHRGGLGCVEVTPGCCKPRDTLTKERECDELKTLEGKLVKAISSLRDHGIYFPDLHARNRGPFDKEKAAWEQCLTSGQSSCERELKNLHTEWKEYKKRIEKLLMVEEHQILNQRDIHRELGAKTREQYQELLDIVQRLIPGGPDRPEPEGTNIPRKSRSQ